MKKRLSVIILLLLFCLSGYAQPMIYQLPRSTERKMEKWIQKLPREIQDSVFFQIANVSPNTREYKIACTTYGDDRWAYLAHLSNRYLTIKNHCYPVILDYDDSFALTKEQLHAIPGEVGHRDGLIKRVAVLFHGKVFHFKTKRSPRSLENENLLPEVTPKASSQIVYYLNDGIETSLKTYYYSLPDHVQSISYVVLSKEEDQLSLTFYDDEQERGVSTNRYILIDKKTVPLFFDYDKAFCYEEYIYDHSIHPIPQYRLVWSNGNIVVQSLASD